MVATAGTGDPHRWPGTRSLWRRSGPVPAAVITVWTRHAGQDAGRPAPGPARWSVAWATRRIDPLPRREPRSS